MTMTNHTHTRHYKKGLTYLGMAIHAGITPSMVVVVVLLVVVVMAWALV